MQHSRRYHFPYLSVASFLIPIPPTTAEAIDLLQENDALHINDQACFDGIYSGIK